MSLWLKNQMKSGVRVQIIPILTKHVQNVRPRWYDH